MILMLSLMMTVTYYVEVKMLIAEAFVKLVISLKIRANLARLTRIAPLLKTLMSLQIVNAVGMKRKSDTVTYYQVIKNGLM